MLILNFLTRVQFIGGQTRDMVSKTIKVLKTIEDELNSKEWVDFVSKNRIKNSEKNLEKLIIDFSDTEYIYTIQLVSLACLIEEYYQEGIEIEFTECLNKYSVCNYLSDIKFFNYWDEGFDRESYTGVANTNCLCLWKINQAMIVSYTDNAQKFAQTHWINGKDFSPLHQSLSEIFNNINDHSKSKISGYIITQYHPTHEQLRISVCDFGEGIGNSVYNFMREEKDEELDYVEALKKAFKMHFTVGSKPHNKGMGLYYIRENVCLNGDLNIYTNSIHMEVEPNKLKPSYLTENFKGTLIDIVINTNNLVNIDNEEVELSLY